MALVLVTAPTEEPVTLAEAKAHLRVDVADDDTYITALIRSARLHVETVARRALVTQTWDLVLNSWPDEGEIVIPLPALRSVASLKYAIADATEKTVSASDYAVDTASEPGRLVLKDGKSWPAETLSPAAPIKLRFEAGYGTATAVPQPIKQAILLLIASLYEYREAVNGDGRALSVVPLAFDALIWPYRVLTFA